MSAWKKPSRMAWRRNERSTVRPSAFRSWPGGLAARRGRRSGCRRSIRASARASCVRRQSTVGTRKRAVGQRGRPAMLSAISEMAAASSRRSISISTGAARVSTTATGRSRRDGGWKRSIRRAAKIVAVEIAAEALLDAGPQDLHRHVAAHAVVDRRPPCAPGRWRRRRPAGRTRRSDPRACRRAPPRSPRAPPPSRTAAACPAGGAGRRPAPARSGRRGWRGTGRA